MSAVPAVLDSWALIAYFRNEPGASEVAALVCEATADEPLHMSEVNFAEVKYTIIRKDGPDRWQAVAQDWPRLPLRLHPATHAQAERAGDLKAGNRMSLADAFAVALAVELGGELATGDPEILAMGSVVQLRRLESSS